MGFDLHDIHLFHVFFHFLVLDSAHATRTAGGEAFCCLSLHEKKRKLPGAKWQQGGRRGYLDDHEWDGMGCTYHGIRSARSERVREGTDRQGTRRFFFVVTVSRLCTFSDSPESWLWLWWFRLVF
jgi:hypothetical protein